MFRHGLQVEGGVGAAVQAAAICAVARVDRHARRFWVQRASWWLGRRFDAGNSVVVPLGQGKRLRVWLDDGYWTVLLDPKFRYEPEVEHVLRRVLSAEVDFLDCGANIGYWSVLALGRVRSVVAVEPAPEAFARLLGNVHLNADLPTRDRDAGIRCVEAALWHREGEVLDLYTHYRMHAAASAVTPPAAGAEEPATATPVPTTTLDALVSQHCAPDSGLVVKLDVEGAEIEALEGARRILADRDVVLVYEDHGADPASRVSRHLLGLGLELFAVGADGTCHPADLSEIGATKTNPGRGYNFVACPPGSHFVPMLTAAARQPA